MPRPQRNKFTAPLTAAAVTSSAAEPAPGAPGALVVSSHSDTATSSDSDGLVQKIRTDLNSSGVPRQDAFMSGALSDRAEPGPQRRRGGRTAQTRKAGDEKQAIAIAALKKRKEGADARARQTAEVLVPASQPEKQQAPASQLLQKSPTVRQSVEPIQLPKPVPATVERPTPIAGANRKAQATPSSILSLAKFKRRPRESSILRIGPENESLSLTSLGGDLDDTFGDLENVKPLDESTPLNFKARAESGGHLDTLRRKPLISTPSHASPIGPRKRKITPSSPPKEQSPSQNPSPRSDPVINEPQSDIDASEQDEPTLPSPKRRAIEPSDDVRSDTMAPPQSSSPVCPRTAAAQAVPTAPKNKFDAAIPGARRGRSVKPEGSAAAKITRKKKEPLRPMTTSVLQNMLPRRRVTRAVRDEFELSSSEAGARQSSPVDEDADELSFLPSKKKRAARRPATTRKPHPKPLRELSTKSSRFNPATGAKSAKMDKRAAKKTYARRLSDKENEAEAGVSVGEDKPWSPNRGRAADSAGALDSSSIMDLPEKERRVLKRMARKFKEIDKWDMTFEDITASSSSPRDAR